MAGTSDNTPLRVIQVGLGGWGQNWYQTRLAPSPLVRTVGWVDASEAALEAAQKRLALAAEGCFTSLADALNARNADAVVVTASLPGHVPSAKQALEAGKHVLMEKPFAPSVAEARSLAAQASAAGRLLMISQNYRYFPAPIHAAALVSSGELGKLGVIHIDFRRDLGGPYDERRRGHYELPNPLLADMSIHHFDLMRMITGANARRVRCHTYNPPWSHHQDPPAGEAVVEMENGVVVTYRGSWVSPGAQTPWSGEWRMEFEKGELRFTSRDDQTGKRDVLRIKRRGDRERTVRLQKVELADRSGSLAEFVAAVRAGRLTGADAPATAAAGNIGSIGLTYASIEAAATGGWVAVENE